MDAIHLNLDGAWDAATLPVPTIEARNWGPRLRYHARGQDLDDFLGEVGPRLKPLVIYGSGDFHHLAAILLRRVTRPVTVVSFDNHPDWDIRPPRWACGGWVNRALELPDVEAVSVWGCGNFELRWPSRLFMNRRGVKSGRLQVHAWAERQPPDVQKRFPCMTRDNWRERFEEFLLSLGGLEVYVTVDLDCLRSEEAVTNWENGLFTAADVAWSIERLRERATIAGGDICGAYSEPAYSRWFQRLAGNWDHPKLPPVDVDGSRTLNLAALRQTLTAFRGANSKQVCRTPPSDAS